MVASTAFATRFGGSVCPEIPWSVCPETVGQLAPKWCGLIHHNLHKDEPDEKQIGELYGFSLCVRREREPHQVDDMIQYRYFNSMYAESSETQIKYLQNNGHPNIDNPKTAARYFLNAIDRTGHLVEKYERKVKEIKEEIPVLRQIVERKFEKDEELAELKQELAKLEKEINDKIAEKNKVVELEFKNASESNGEENVVDLPPPEQQITEPIRRSISR